MIPKSRLGFFQREREKGINEPHLRQIEIPIPLHLLVLVAVGGISLSQITTDSPNTEIQVIPQRDSAHDEAHVEGAESQLELAGAEVAFGDVEAGHCVGIAPNWDHGVPRPRVELLPG